MAGLEVVSTAIERMKMDSPTSNSSDCTLRTNTSFSSHSRTSSGFHSQGIMEGTSIDVENHHGSLETLNTSFQEFDCAERYPRLVELGRAPWTDEQVEEVLQNCEELKKQSRSISYSSVQRLSYLLQRPLIRIVREARRLSLTYNKCTKHDLTAAMRIVLSYNLADLCLKAATKALSSYQMNAGNFKQCKRKRAGLTFSVGQFFRWMLDAKVAGAVDDHAAVFLTACMENLAVEVVKRASLMYVGKDSSEFTMEMLELGVSDDAETWGLLQPFEHLICGRSASGLVVFPSSSSITRLNGLPGEQSHGECDHNAMQGHEANRQMEQSMMVTCVGSISELGELVARATHYLQNFQKLSSGYNQHCEITWSSHALQTLFHFMKCNQLENQDAPPDHHQHSIQLTPERSFVVLPPLLEWMRVASAHCLHRFGSCIDADDVLQAARVLLPGMDCPVRPLRCSEGTSFVRALDADKSALKFKRNLGFQMLESGRADLVPHAAQLLGTDGLNTINEQGLTPLMFAALQGDEGMVQILLENGAEPDTVVPSNPQKYPCVHPAIRHWTALSFAVNHKHTSVSQLLLDSGASVEGSVEIHGDNYTHSPLQLASAEGHLEQVCLLLAKGADPYLTTSQNDCFSSKGYNNSFALAASHGHRSVLRKLLEQPHSRRSSDILSLEEMLAEGVDAEEPRRRERKPSKSAKNKMSAALQEAMYHSCEHSFLDIVMELRSLGIPWTLHCWTETLKINKQLHRRANLQCLLRDFGSIRLEEDWEEFISDGLLLLFEIFRYSRDEVLSRQLASIFSSLYGSPEIPEIEIPVPKALARIDPHFVNNPDMSDVTFIVEGQPFYAHKIVLVTASKRFKSLLSEARNSDGVGGGSKLPSIEISDIKYNIFKLVMEYLYHGNADQLQIASKDILELLAAASFFSVDGLVLYCSRLCSQKLTPETALTIYRHARLYNSPSLISYCHAYFLINFGDLLTQNEAFRKLLRGNRPHQQDTLAMMQQILSYRIREMHGMKNTSV